MSTIYRRRGERFSNNFNAHFSANPMVGYSFYQKESQNIAQGLYYETTLGKTIIDSMTLHVVGSGLTPMASPELSILKWDTARAKRFQKEAEAFYRIITQDSNFDFYGKNPFKELQKVAFKAILTTGDVLLHRGYRKLNNGKVVPYVQVISGKMVMNPAGRLDDETYRGGVIIDKRTGRETGYCIQKLDNNLHDTYSTDEVKKYNRTFGFDEFTLVTLQNSDPLQVRGVPLLTPVRDDILQVTKLKDNYLIRSVVQNLFAGAIEKTEPVDPSSLTFQEKLKASMSESQDENFAPNEDIKLEPGIMIELEPGEKMASIQPSMQAEDFSSGLKSLIGVVSSAFGIPYEVLMSSYNASFSASRASINGAEKKFKEVRDEFNSKFNNLVYEMVIDYGIRTGAIECEEYFQGGLFRKAVLGCTWVGVTPLQVDPVKEVNAYKEAIEGGLCTHELAARNLFGMDFEEVVERLEEEQSALRKVISETNATDATGNNGSPVSVDNPDGGNEDTDAGTEGDADGDDDLDEEGKDNE